MFDSIFETVSVCSESPIMLLPLSYVFMAGYILLGQGRTRYLRYLKTVTFGILVFGAVAGLVGSVAMLTYHHAELPSFQTSVAGIYGLLSTYIAYIVSVMVTVWVAFTLILFPLLYWGATLVMIVFPKTLLGTSEHLSA